jgi:hypothetical protein
MVKIKKHSMILVLVPILLGLGVLSFLVKQTAFSQLQIVVVGLMLYLLFSLIHHYFDKTLTFETVVEYILIAGLVFVILAGNFT